MGNKKVYAKVRNPEFFEPQWYEDSIGEDVFIKGSRDCSGFNDDMIKDIQKLARDYDGYDYEFYYHESIKEFLNDYLPKKINGKKLSPNQIKKIQNTLDLCDEYRYYNDYENEVIVTCLTIIMGKPYCVKAIHGCSQGDYAEMFIPKDTKQTMIDYIEAWYFGTGTEIEIHDESNKVRKASDICGYTFYTSEYSEDKIKELVAENANCNIKNVVLFKFNGYKKVEDYERC